jgi:hypothetical protein
MVNTCKVEKDMQQSASFPLAAFVIVKRNMNAMFCLVIDCLSWTASFDWLYVMFGRPVQFSFFCLM